MKKCRICGSFIPNRIPDNATVCPICGTPLKKKTPTIVIVLIICFGLFWAWVIIHNILHANDPEQTAEPVEAQTETEQEPVETAPESELAYTYKSVLEMALNENFPDGNSVVVDNESKIITINLWSEGVVQELYLASQGDQEYIDAWKTAKEQFRQMCQNRHDDLGDYGISDYHVVLNIVNNLNKDNILFSCMDGAVLYDALEADS